MTLKDIERVLYFENYIVIEPGLTPLKQQAAAVRRAVHRGADEYGEDSFTAGIGAEAIRELLMADQPRASCATSCARRSRIDHRD
jgi:DNA-directed RNA polymerase subunit beta'